MRLVPLSDEHVPDLDALLRDPDVLAYTLVPDVPPPGFSEGWVERYAAKRAEGAGEGWAVLDTDGTFLGLALVPTMDRERAECELGYIIAPAARGRGVGAAVLDRMTTWAFAQGMQRIVLLISPDNRGSIGVARRAGYVHEGTHRNTYFKDGRRSDVMIWAKLPSDP